jgi:nitroreductase
MRINQTQLDAATVMTAPEAALSRRSIRNYAPTPIPDADLLQLLRLAGRAPSAFNVQPWRFVVVQDDDLKAKLAEVAHGQQQIVRAPATIVMYSDMESALARIPEAMHPDMPAEKRDAGVQGFRGTFAKQTVDEREAWGNAQTNIALGYLLLLAESLGYATSPMLGFDPEKVKAQLGLPAHVRITALVSVGYPAEEGFRPHRLSVDTLVEFR